MSNRLIYSGCDHTPQIPSTCLECRIKKLEATRINTLRKRIKEMEINMKEFEQYAEVVAEVCDANTFSTIEAEFALRMELLGYWEKSYE